ncbi:hypothetical protein Tco_0341007 [Tanacetum coccineum]
MLETKTNDMFSDVVISVLTYAVQGEHTQKLSADALERRRRSLENQAKKAFAMSKGKFTYPSLATRSMGKRLSQEHAKLNQSLSDAIISENFKFPYHAANYMPQMSTSAMNKLSNLKDIVNQTERKKSSINMHCTLDLGLTIQLYDVQRNPTANGEELIKLKQAPTKAKHAFTGYLNIDPHFGVKIILTYLEVSVTPPDGAWTEYVSGGVTLLSISSTKHKERPLRRPLRGHGAEPLAGAPLPGQRAGVEGEPPLVGVWGQQPQRGSGQRPDPNGKDDEVGKLDKFEGSDFRRWQKKMHFLLTTLKVAYF